MNNITRHQDLFQPEMLKDTPVHVIGCGATGGAIALNLVKLGVPEIHLYDMDKIEEHNIANQIFRVNQIGEYKVEALKQILEEHKVISDTNIYVHNKLVDDEFLEHMTLTGNAFRGYVFCATDTMSSRKEIFDEAIRCNIGVKRWIEPRMGLDIFLAYTIDPNNPTDCKAYAETLYSDDEVQTESACGATQTAFPTANITAAYCVWLMLADLNNKLVKNECVVGLPDLSIIRREFK